MADRRILRVILAGDSAGLRASMAEAEAETTGAAKSMGTSVGGLGKDMEKAEGKTKGFISKLAGFASNTGIPFSKSLEKVGTKLDDTSTKGKHFSTAMSAAGGTILGVGIAAVAGIGAEALHMADKFDTAQSNMDTAIKNAGGSVQKLTPDLNKAYGAMANLGFNMTDTATAMATLTTATNKPKVALKDLGLAADLARMKNISLSAAGQTLAKVYAGSTRALTQLGINIDIGTGKLTAIHTATESLATAQIHLKQTRRKSRAGRSSRTWRSPRSPTLTALFRLPARSCTAIRAPSLSS